jgi:predicted CopG family antitoxin
MHAYMSMKTVSLADGAYEQLRALKQERESFSDVVRMLAARKPLTALAGLLTTREAAQLAAVVRACRARSRQRAHTLTRQFSDS